MPDKFADIAFTSAVKAVQEALGSRKAYARREFGPDVNGRLGEHEKERIARRADLFAFGKLPQKFSDHLVMSENQLRAAQIAQLLLQRRRADQITEEQGHQPSSMLAAKFFNDSARIGCQ